MPDAPNLLNLPGSDSLTGLGHMSSLLGWAVLAVCALFWLAMLVDCLRRPAFYPVLGNTWRTRVFWVLTFVFLNPLITLTYLIFGRLLPPKPRASWTGRIAIIGIVALLGAGQLWPSSALSPQILRLHRDPASGQMKLESGLLSAGVGVNAATTESSNSSTSVTSSSGNDEMFFPCEHIVVFGSSKHPLMQKVAGLLCTRVGQLPYVKTVDYYPPGKTATTGGRLPDLLITLDAPKLSETTLPGYREVSCVVTVAAGQTPWSSSHCVMTNNSPPVLNASFSSRLEHSSKTAGVVTGDARFTAAAKSIVEQIEGSLLKAVGEWHTKHNNATDLPASFYGQYTAPAEPFFATRPASWQVALSGASIFENNRTIWRFEDNRSSKEVLTEIKDQLTGLGFKTDDFDVPYMRMSKGEQEFELYRERTNEPTVTEDSSMRPQTFVAVYRLRFSDAQRCQAIEDLLASATSADQLVPVQLASYSCPNGLNDRILERIAHLPATSPHAMIALAEWHQSRGEKDAARASLRGAAALAWADNRKSELESRLKDLGRKLGMEKIATSQPGVEDLISVNIPQLPPVGQSIQRSVAAGESVRAWHMDRSGKLYYVRGTVLHGAKAGEPFRVSAMVGSNDGTATCTAGMSPITGAAKGSWLGTSLVGNNGVHIGATATSNDGQHFNLTVQLTEDTSPATAPASTPSATASQPTK